MLESLSQTAHGHVMLLTLYHVSTAVKTVSIHKKNTIEIKKREGIPFPYNTSNYINTNISIIVIAAT